MRTISRDGKRISHSERRHLPRVAKILVECGVLNNDIFGLRSSPVIKPSKLKDIFKKKKEMNSSQ